MEGHATLPSSVLSGRIGCADLSPDAFTLAFLPITYMCLVYLGLGIALITSAIERARSHRQQRKSFLPSLVSCFCCCNAPPRRRRALLAPTPSPSGGVAAQSASARCDGHRLQEVELSPLPSPSSLQRRSAASPHSHVHGAVARAHSSPALQTSPSSAVAALPILCRAGSAPRVQPIFAFCLACAGAVLAVFSIALRAHVRALGRAHPSPVPTALAGGGAALSDAVAAVGVFAGAALALMGTVSFREFAWQHNAAAIAHISASVVFQALLLAASDAAGELLVEPLILRYRSACFAVALFFVTMIFPNLFVERARTAEANRRRTAARAAAAAAHAEEIRRRRARADLLTSGGTPLAGTPMSALTRTSAGAPGARPGDAVAALPPLPPLTMGPTPPASSSSSSSSSLPAQQLSACAAGAHSPGAGTDMDNSPTGRSPVGGNLAGVARRGKLKWMTAEDVVAVARLGPGADVSADASGGVGAATLRAAEVEAKTDAVAEPSAACAESEAAAAVPARGSVEFQIVTARAHDSAAVEGRGGVPERYGVSLRGVGDADAVSMTTNTAAASLSAAGTVQPASIGAVESVLLRRIDEPCDDDDDSCCYDVRTLCIRCTVDGDSRFHLSFWALSQYLALIVSTAFYGSFIGALGQMCVVP